MPQGNTKNRRKGVVPQIRKKAPVKSSLKLQKGKGSIKKPKKLTENKKLQVKLQKEINASIEEEAKLKASNASTSLKILKSETQKDKKKK